MKILLYSSYFYPYISGLTTYPLVVLEHLGQKHDVTVLTFPYSSSHKKQEIYNNISIQRMPYMFKISKGYISPQSLIFFFREILRSNIIFLNLPNAEGIPLAILGKLFNKKIVSIYHCHVFLGETPFAKIINSILNYSVFLQLLLSDTIFCYTRDYVNSIPMMKQFDKKIQFGYPPFPPPPVDTEKLSFLKKRKGNEIWIGYAGRVAREKGIEFLIDAISSINNPNIRFVCAGPYGKNVAGEERYYIEILNRLKISKLKFTFLGSMKEGNLGAYYKAIDILILPSTNQTEAFGIVQIEAQQLGTPVIASNLPGVREPIRKTGMGIIVEPKSVNDIQKAITEILKNKDQYSSIDQRKTAQEIFNPSHTLQLFDDILA
ncbi:MAG: glycosyltransferase family 4 protein [Candidatus Roizmanbacteria bacterium]